MGATILYSADYEIFLGENFLPEREVLIEPTERLLSRCDELGIPMTLFVDVACLWGYRERGDDVFPDAVEEQLRDAVRRGHDVQVHLHPHWLGGNPFLVGLLDDAAPLLERGRDYLEGVAGRRCAAFRAGNYGIQPRREQVFSALRETGYVVDSSVVPGFVQRNAVNRTDFRAFSAEDGWLDGMYEVPIPSRRFGPFDFARRRLRRTPPRPRRGTTVQAETGAEAFLPRLRRGLRRFDFLELRVDVHPLKAITRRHLTRHPDSTFSLSCHPKGVGEADLEVLARYHEWLVERYDVRAITFAQLVEELARPELEVERAPQLEPR